MLDGRLRLLLTRRRPFTTEPQTKEKAYWVRPELVARVRYGSWTKDRVLRHPVYLGLRDDIDPVDCVDPAQPVERSKIVYAPAVDAIPVLQNQDELAEELFGGRRESVKAKIGGKLVRLTHLDKVYFPEPGLHQAPPAGLLPSGRGLHPAVLA